MASIGAEATEGGEGVQKHCRALQLHAWDRRQRGGFVLWPRPATGRRRAWQVRCRAAHPCRWWSLCELRLITELQFWGHCKHLLRLAAYVVRGRRFCSRACSADLVTPYGYPLEQYTVPTRDGYLLGLFRISHGAGAANSTDR